MLNYLVNKFKTAFNRISYFNCLNDERHRLTSITIGRIPLFQAVVNESLRGTAAARIERNCSTQRARFELSDTACGSAISTRHVLTRVAELVDAPGTLAELALSAESEVRVAVADNQHTPDCIKLLLVEDDDPDVRYILAENCHTPKEVLELLVEDDNPYIAARARRTLEATAQNATASIPWRNLHRKSA